MRTFEINMAKVRQKNVGLWDIFVCKQLLAVIQIICISLLQLSQVVLPLYNLLSPHQTKNVHLTEYMCFTLDSIFFFLNNQYSWEVI